MTSHERSFDTLDTLRARARAAHSAEELRAVLDESFALAEAAIGARASGRADAIERARAEPPRDEPARRRDELLGKLGHELRNPLGAIASAVEVLELLGPSEPHLEKAHAVIARQVQHMRRLLDDLRDVTRISRGKLAIERELLDVSDLWRSTIDEHRAQLERAGVALSSSLGEEPLFVHGDPVRLAQVLSNLLANAAAFTPAGGRVDIELGVRDGHAAIEVRDTGLGVDGAHDVFDPAANVAAHRDRAGGPLFGLALVKGLTLLHGGTVDCESEGPGRGATFTVRLPLAYAIAKGPDEPPHEHRAEPLASE